MGDDYYPSSYEYEPEYNSDSRNRGHVRSRRKPKSDQVVSSYSYYGNPYSGFASRSGNSYGSHDSYGGHSGHGGGYGGGGKCKCCCDDNNNLAMLAALALGFLALNGQLQNIIDAINARRRKRRAADDSRAASGKLRAHSKCCF